MLGLSKMNPMGRAPLDSSPTPDEPGYDRTQLTSALELLRRRAAALPDRNIAELAELLHRQITALHAHVQILRAAGVTRTPPSLARQQEAAQLRAVRWPVRVAELEHRL